MSISYETNLWGETRMKTGYELGLRPMLRGHLNRILEIQKSVFGESYREDMLKLHGKKTYLTFRFENEKNAACAENNLSQIIAARSLSLFSTGYRKFTII